MAKIQINNPRQIINGGAKKYYFKVKGLGGPKGDKGDKGDTGATGPQGPQGNAATVSVGSTTTLPVGYDATVTNSGSIYNAVLDFGIPQGPRGPQGAKGDKGDTGAQGETGPRGPQGEKGTNATVSVGSTTTTNPGTQARVYNSGTDSNAVLNFEIPRGDVGPQPELVQTTGTSTTKAMSQNATTVALATKQNTIDSSHKLSADLVDDTSTTNKFVTASDKTTWNAKQNALTAGDNITISGDTISTPAIAPEVVAELPETGAEGKLYLTPKNYTRSTATGNPIKATITDGAGSMESFQLDGDTFQQSYTGKNLFDFVSRGTDQGLTATYDTTTGIIAVTGTAASNYSNISTNIDLTLEAGQTFTSSIDRELPVRAVTRVTYTDDTASSFNIEPGQTSVTWSPVKQVKQIRLYISLTVSGTSYNLSFKFQIEAGSTATSFEPYVGGTPSPNPDYPQAIQTVTGVQTISINGTDYEIDLGSIELCKLGTYQDYIYKSGDDWKVHKAIKKSVFDQNSGWEKNKYGTNAYNVKAEDIFTAVAEIGVISPQFIAKSYNGRTDAVNNIIFADSNDGMSTTSRGITIRNTAWSDLTSFITWVTSNPVTAYYVLAAPTDTEITDTTLIAQLEAIRTASLENGANTITNSTPAPNLAGDMEIGYYGYNPTNRYDKFIWLDLNNNYEQIGS